MRIVGHGKHREVLLAQHHDTVRALDELPGHLRTERHRDRLLVGAVRRTRRRCAQIGRGEGAVGEEDRTANEDEQHDQPEAAAAHDPALVRGLHAAYVRPPGSVACVVGTGWSTSRVRACLRTSSGLQ